ncbi:MAG: peptidylprolyl isomerase, partial [Candidatus Marinimicrobia bacterium]|nr:peptidylprolyl isomerase [Candidatus Neomarinimicrobiota bacterium]
HSNTKIMLWILILAFVGLIVFEWGASFSGQGGQQGQPKNIAVINGREITPQQYYRLLQNEYERVRQQSQNSALTEQQRNQIEQQLWDQLVTETLVRQAVEERNIQVTNQDILRELRTNPPQAIRNVEAFQTDGQFDRNKYLEALNNPVGDEWVAVENMVRASLPAQKLQSMLLASVNVYQDEIRQAYVDQNINFTIEYLQVPLRNISDEEAQPAEAEIKEYYQSHIDEYRVPEKRVLEYAEFPKTPANDDTAAALNTARDVLEQARNGADFAELARQYSEGPSASQGGDLGWFGEGQMVPGFEEAAFDADAGAVVGPVQTRFGYHVIKVHDKRVQDGENQIKASHVLIEVTPSPTTLEEQRSQANLFLFDAQDYSFQKSADSNDVTIQSTNPFARDAGFVPGLGQFEEALRFAFSNPVGSISDVIENDNGYYVFRVAEIQQPFVRPLEDLRDRISRTLVSENKRKIAFQRIQEVHGQVSTEISLEELAESNELLVYESTESFTLSGNIPGLGEAPALKGAIRALDGGEISPAIRTSRGGFIIKVLERSELNEEDYAEKKQQIRQRLLNQKQNQFMTNWIESLRNEAKIVDNREQIL